MNDLKYPKNPHKKPKVDKKHLSLLYYAWCRSQGGDPHHVKKIGSGGDRTQPSKKHFYIVSLPREKHNIADRGPEAFLRETGEDIWELVAEQQAEFLWQLATGKLNELIRAMSVYDDLIGKINMKWTLNQKGKK